MITQRLLVEIKTCDIDMINPGPIVLEKKDGSTISVLVNGNGTYFELQKADVEAAILALFPKL